MPPLVRAKHHPLLYSEFLSTYGGLEIIISNDGKSQSSFQSWFIKIILSVLLSLELIFATNPKYAAEGKIRKKYGISIDKNSVHGSDSVENAKIEIDFFFKN